MSWTIEIKPSAEKQYLQLDKQARTRIKDALYALKAAEIPLRRDGVRALTGPLKGDYRMRVGRWRILFSPDMESKVLQNYAILPRSKAY